MINFFKARASHFYGGDVQKFGRHELPKRFDLMKEERRFPGTSMAAVAESRVQVLHLVLFVLSSSTMSSIIKGSEGLPES